MPLPTDEKLIALSEELLKEFDIVYGQHPGFRPAHAKGMLLTGAFSPSPDAASLTRAKHIARESTPVTVRFSDSTGIPLIPDNDQNANPHGCAVRFHLAEHEHTDIISHSIDGFPARTGAEFLELLRAIAADNPSKSSPSPIEAFLGTHPAAFAFVQARPSPSSFARQAYFAISSFRFTNKAGVTRYGRYRILPEAGEEYLDDATLKTKDASFLFDDLKRRISAGPVSFQVKVQIPNEKDVVNDATTHWPEDRPSINFGKLVLTALVPDDAHEQKRIIFDPIPRTDGIEPSDDPLFELRAALYLLSGRRRRQAPESAVNSARAKQAGTQA
jgi:catalase